MEANAPYPEVDPDALVWVSADEMREIDRVAVEELGVSLVQMMENAGRNLADLVIRRFAGATATVLAGRGGNGGGGIAAARHLANRGVDVRIVLGAVEDDLGPVPRLQLETADRMALPRSRDPAGADVVIDALLGYSGWGDPGGRIAELVAWAGDAGAPICSLDVPSGLDATTGAAGSPHVRAAATLTLAMPKTGMRSGDSVAPDVGELYLADISVPAAAFERIGKPVRTPFAASPIVRVRSR